MMPKSKIPASSSFTMLRPAMRDDLITAKLEFFVSTAAIMKSHIQMLQSDVSLLPLISSEIHVLLETLVDKLMKREELQAAIVL